MKGGSTALVVSVLVIASAFVYSMLVMREGDPHSRAVIATLKYNLSLIDPKYAKIPIYEGPRSETVNKSVIYLCMRDSRGRFYSINTLMHVLLHELSHILSKTYADDSNGHQDNEEFQAVFSKIKSRATLVGVYDPSKPLPAIYCGQRS